MGNVVSGAVSFWPRPQHRGPGHDRPCHILLETIRDLRRSWKERSDWEILRCPPIFPTALAQSRIKSFWESERGGHRQAICQSLVLLPWLARRVR